MFRNPAQRIALAAVSLLPLTLPAAESFPGLKLTDGFAASVWADDAHTRNPVAISLDGHGRLYTVEAHRRLTGAWGVTMSRWWSMEDYAGKTLADREAMYARWAHIVPPAKLTRLADISRRIVDRDGDGKADDSSILAEFNGSLEGNAAGVLSVGNWLFVANAPTLWRFELDPDSGRVKSREALLTGFGVRVGVYGHDLHGLNRGPDGRLYFSLGDRGFDVMSKEGKRFSTPTRGAVFRCFPDGTGFEVFHIGLRNPQDLAFNQFGDLFTVDNDMGGVDKSRVVHVIEGGDSGWDATYQLTRNFREETKRHDHTEPPWFTENLWKTRHAGQPSWLYPPIAHLTAGPSGLEFNPGTGFPSPLENAFLICDFKGSSSRSGIYSFKVAQDGAGYRMAETNVFAWGILPADIKFGYDGRLYVADWIGGWGGEGGKRRIVRLEHPASQNTDAHEVAALFKSGFKSITSGKLRGLLAHSDQRVRFAAQYELAQRNEIEPLLQATRDSNSQLMRLHGIWGVWQIGFRKELPSNAVFQLRALLDQSDAETRAQAVKVLGEIGERAHPRAQTPTPGGGRAPDSDLLARRLADESPRVRAAAAIALGRLGHTTAFPELVRMLRGNADRDPALRHAGILALAKLATSKQLVGLRRDASVPVRRAALLALRRRQSPDIAEFLRDAEPELVWEAVRAIHDLPITNAWNALEGPIGAGIIANSKTPFPIAHRVLNADFRAGATRNVMRLSKTATNQELAVPIRLEALRCLEMWNTPSPFDRVTWHHRPITGPRDADIAGTIRPDVLRVFNAEIQPDGNRDLLKTATRLMVQYNLAAPGLTRKLVQDTALDESARLAFFGKLKSRADDAFTVVCRNLLRQKPSPIQVEAAFHLLEQGSVDAKGVIEIALKQGAPGTKALAISRLGNSAIPEANVMLQAGLRARMADRTISTDALDWWMAGRTSPDPVAGRLLGEWKAGLETAHAQLGQFALALKGGDGKRGARLFSTHAVQCVRCHVIKGFGGDAGPELTRIGSTLKREEIVLSLIEPSARIAEGFGTFEFELKDGEPVAGFVMSENDKHVDVRLMDGRTVSLDKKQIVRRSNPTSAMPSMREALTLPEIRDLAAYLSALK